MRGTGLVQGRTQRGRRRLAVPLVALALFASACAGSSDDGTTGTDPTDDATTTTVDLGPKAAASGTPVTIGQITDGKSDGFDQTFEEPVLKATAKYLNEYKEGLAGHPIEIVTCTTGQDSAKTADCANQMVADDVLAVVPGELANVDEIFGPLHEAGIPVIYYAAASGDIILDGETSFVMSSAIAPLIDVPIAAAKAADKDKVTVVLIDVPVAVGLYDSIAPALFAEEDIELDIVKVPIGTADMTPQMQALTESDPGVVHILGNDAFCIAALQGLKAVGYTGPRSMVGLCLTDATHEAIPPEDLAGIQVSETSPVGTNDPDLAIFQTIAAQNDITGARALDRGPSSFVPLVALARALEGTTGELTNESVIAGLQAMPQMELPASAGLYYRCNGNASPIAPATCVRGTLISTLGPDGLPTTYEQVNNTPIE